MKRTFYWFSFVGCLFLFLGGCTMNNPSKQETQLSENQQKQQTAQITIQEDGKTVTNQTVSFKTGDTLLNVLKEHFIIEEEQGFITSIEGHSQEKDKQKYWTFTIDGERATKGAKDIKLKKNQRIVFDLAKV